MRTEETGTDRSGMAWAGWLGIILGIIGLFFLPVWMGIAAIILGIVALNSPSRGLGWAAIILGVIDLLLVFVVGGELW
ncbi:hypothetical protein [Planococcus lenghuensis]|uniref:DUF4190 domain-containing protein n=1 Tax=Planococcus lenghuensis TaxID=2213202 RepID=A0A1Q2L2L5_9BACL|nr:hypothetical protein [Planococcus lenghuensis]AQQ54669.1 hypothetical protein B0X71_17205 [Planococcus lenghuensis]